MRKRRICMGKVGSPHIIMLAKELPGRRTKRIVLESGPHVPTYIIARLHRQSGSVGNLCVDMIETVHPVRNPPDIVLCRDDLQLRKSLKHPAVYHPCETLLYDVNHMDL